MTRRDLEGAVARPVTEGDVEPEEWRKWQDLQAAVRLDATDPATRWRAHRLWELVDGSRDRFVKMAMAMARDAVAYVSDVARTGGEDLAPPSEVWERGADDCDGKARLFCALLNAVRIPCRLEPLWKMGPAGKLWLAHVFASFQDGQQRVPVELTLARARIGDSPQTVPRETSGRWLQ